MTIDVKNAKTTELVTWYNANNSGNKPIKKFVNRATAEMRCAALLAQLDEEQEPRNKSARRVAGAKSSWKDKAIADKRRQRNHVMVDGQEYRSVRQAYELLGLPMKEHIQFRGLLKEHGKLENYDHTWELVPAKPRKRK